MEGDGVFYMLVGRKHWDVLVVSIMSLRDFYDGPICIACGDDDGRKIADMIQQDNRLSPVQVMRFELPRLARRNNGYAMKPMMHELSSFRRTVFLDADTLIRTPRWADVFPSERGQVTLTQFADWTMAMRKLQRRVSGWEDVAPEDHKRIIANQVPAINTGVIGFDSSCGRFMREWLELTRKRISFICDELACQLIFDRHKTRVLNDDYNGSPIHGRWAKGKASRQPYIWHCHGKKEVSREEGRAVWFPFYQRAVIDNYARIQEWTPGDKGGRLAQYLKAQHEQAH